MWCFCILSSCKELIFFVLIFLNDSHDRKETYTVVIIDETYITMNKVSLCPCETETVTIRDFKFWSLVCVNDKL